MAAAACRGRRARCDSSRESCDVKLGQKNRVGARPQEDGERKKSSFLQSAVPVSAGREEAVLVGLGKDRLRGKRGRLHTT